MDETPNDARAHLNDARIAGELEANGSVADERAAALSAAMASLFGDAPESWLLEAEDVLEHLRMSGYCIVPTDRLDRLMDTASAAKEFTDTMFLLADSPLEVVQPTAISLGRRIADAVLVLQPGDLEQSGAGE